MNVDEEKKKYEELKSLLYTGTISQYGKRKLIDIIEKQSREIEEFKKRDEETFIHLGECIGEKKVEDKIKEKVIEIKNKPVKDEFITASQGKLDTIIEIESLLERK